MISSLEPAARRALLALSLLAASGALVSGIRTTNLAGAGDWDWSDDGTYTDDMTLTDDATWHDDGPIGEDANLTGPTGADMPTDDGCDWYWGCEPELPEVPDYASQYDGYDDPCEPDYGGYDPVYEPVTLSPDQLDGAAEWDDDPSIIDALGLDEGFLGPIFMNLTLQDLGGGAISFPTCYSRQW